jgi:hypothetical protein
MNNASMALHVTSATQLNNLEVPQTAYQAQLPPAQTRVPAFLNKLYAYVPPYAY